MVALERLAANGYFYSVPVVRNSYLFVDFFFVLSGFVIAHAYGARIYDRASTISFAIRRFGRLWPLHAALLGLFIAYELVKLALSARGVGGAVAPFTGTQSVESIFTNLLLVQALGIYDHLTWNMPSWSISTEFWTYLVFAVVCLTASRWIVGVSLALVAGGLAVVALYSPDYMNATYDYGFFRCVAGFFVGVLVHRLYVRLGEPSASVSRNLPWLELASLVLVVAFVWKAGVTALSLAAPFVFAIPLLLIAYERGPVSRLLLTRPFRALGDWSYSIYMVNLFVVLMIERAANAAEKLLGRSVWTTTGTGERLLEVGPKWTMDLLAIVYLAAVLLMAAITYRLVEDPARRFFNRLADRVAGRNRETMTTTAAQTMPRGRLMVE